MADYRELLRTAIDALPENTGANRRAVYEKARGALVSQLRAIDPPLPAREITQHRLKLEDCIREVEQEATDMLLGRHREDVPEADAKEQEDLTAPAAVVEDIPEEAGSDTPALEGEPDGTEALEPAAAPVGAADEDGLAEDRDAMATPPIADEPLGDATDDAWNDQAESQIDSGEEERSEDAFGVAPVADNALEAVVQENEQPVSADPDQADLAEPIAWTEPYVEPEPSADQEPAAEHDADASAHETGSVAQEPEAQAEALEPFEPEVSDHDQAPETGDVVPIKSPHQEPTPSIEDIIAQASAESEAVSLRAASDEAGTGDSPAGAAPEVTTVQDEAPHREKHFIASPYESDARPGELVDMHGKPLGHHAAASAVPLTAAGFGEAMSSVREVEIEANAPDSSDPQSAIDRAIAALDREARGETEVEAEGVEESPDGAKPTAAAETPADDAPTPAADDTRSGGFGAFTMFLVIAIVLLAGGGAGGYWAWQQGYIDLDAVFVQSGPDATAPSEIAQGEDVLEPVTEPDAEAETPAEPEVEAPVPDEPVNTTDAPDPSGSENGADVSSETETPATNGDGPELAFEDRLPAEAETPAADTPAAEATQDLAAADGPQSLLLEEQPNGNSGAVPYSGSVTWSRGTDELGDPTIVANASIPARNLEVEVLLRRNADQTLPASHLMEVNFDVAETFVGGTIANLPGVLLKDEELVQGQPLTGASARIVGNSFLFALSRASEQDVANNETLLRERDWLDLAMVYGTGRRAILTLEKGEAGDAIFQEVMDAWAALDEAAQASAETTAE